MMVEKTCIILFVVVVVVVGSFSRIFVCVCDCIYDGFKTRLNCLVGLRYGIKFLMATHNHSESFPKSQSEYVFGSREPEIEIHLG